MNEPKNHPPAFELADLSAAIVRDKFYQFAEWHQRDRVPLPPRNG